MIKTTFSLLVFLLLSNLLFAQSLPTLSPKTKREVIESLQEMVAQLYIFPEKGEEMADMLDKKRSQNAYARIKTPEAFAEQLTQDLQAVSKDFHLMIYSGPSTLDVYSDTKEIEYDDGYYLARDKRQNFGFLRTEILGGNIGYVRFDDFAEWEAGQKTVAAAFAFVQHTDALVIDLRQNTGGSPEMMAYIASYFFPKKPQTSFSSLYFRPSDTTVPLRSVKKLDGPRLEKMPLFFLIGANTASAAEGLAYDLQQLGRATLIGDTTRGGANPAQVYALPDGFRAMIPIGKAINPITQTNWEGTGVFPDQSVPAADALLAGHFAALSLNAAQFPENQPLIDKVALLVHQTTIPPEDLQPYLGTYGEREIVWWEDKLYYINHTSNITTRLLLQPDGNFTFESNLTPIDQLPKLEFYRVEAQVAGYFILYPSGNKKEIKRTVKDQN